MTAHTWSLGRRITALCAIVAALLGVIAISAAVTAAANRTDTQHLMDRLTPAEINAETLHAQLLRTQSSVRTYTLTGIESDLDAYNDARQMLTDTVARMQVQLADETALLDRLSATDTAIAAYRREVTEPLIAQVRTGGASAALATPDERSRTVYTAASTAIAELSRAIDVRRTATAAQVRSTGNVLILLLGSAAVVVVVAGVALALLLRRLVTTPVVDLAAEVRRVADGDYDYEISTAGPPELTRLAGDINTMRQRIAEDLTEVRRAREAVELANQRLEEQADELTRSNRDLEQFAYVASHDLQEPLRKVASFCQLLQRRYSGQLDERADQYIGFAVDGAQRMQRLINDLLAFSRIGRLTAGFDDVDLNKIVVDAAAQFEALRDETGAEITFEDLPVVRGEEPLLGALLANLIGNAIKFRHPDRTPRVHLSARRVGDDYELSCEDNGIGIAPEFADKVFVIFQRLHAKETYPGTGIGLAIAKKIVEYHGGRIWIDPQHRDGTLFRFTLPVPQLAPAIPTQQPTEETVS